MSKYININKTQISFEPVKSEMEMYGGIETGTKKKTSNLDHSTKSEKQEDSIIADRPPTQMPTLTSVPPSCAVNKLNNLSSNWLQIVIILFVLIAIGVSYYYLSSYSKK